MKIAESSRWGTFILPMSRNMFVHSGAHDSCQVRGLWSTTGPKSALYMSSVEDGLL